jgi:UDP-2,3-diacylglucosamine pyrophosphatase LpxH
MAKRYTVISDLHLGDGGPADQFDTLGSAPLLERLLQSVEADPDCHLVLLGDTFEFWQFGLEAICSRYERLLELLQCLARDGRLSWVIGNHDYELPYLKTDRWFGDFPFTQAFDLPELGLHAVHGHMQDPHPERMVPLPGHEREFEVSRELVYYVKYLEHVYPDAEERLTALGLTLQRGWDDARTAFEAFMALDRKTALSAFLDLERRLLHYVPPSQALTVSGQDPWELAAFQMMQQSPYKTVLMGHTHVPRWVRTADLTYINTGCWCRSAFPCSFVQVDVEARSVALWRMERQHGGACPIPWTEIVEHKG